MKLKAIALDMDGTLLNSKSKINEACIKLFERLHDKGIHIFLSTGRTKAQVYEVLLGNFPFDGDGNGKWCRLLYK